jgi:PAS domain S-box-containing protein
VSAALPAQVGGRPVASLVADEPPWTDGRGDDVVRRLLDPDGDRVTVPVTIADGDTRLVSFTTVARQRGDGVVCLGSVGPESTRHHPGQEGVSVFDLVADPIYVLDAADRITRVNDAFVDLIGYDRETLHERTAAAIERVHEGELEAYTERLATHHERAENYEQAFDYHRQTAARAVETYANDEAITHYERALQLADDHDVGPGGVRATVSSNLGDIHERRGEYDRAEERYQDAREVAADVGDRASGHSQEPRDGRGTTGGCTTEQRATTRRVSRRPGSSTTERVRRRR